jgi:hypothetical protein
MAMALKGISSSLRVMLDLADNRKTATAQD